MTDLSIGARGHDLERDVEAELGKRLKALGCLFWKFVSPGTSGVPDRIVLTPTGTVYFVELKAAGGRRDEIQVYRAEQIAAHGGNYRLVVGKAGAKEFVREVEDVIRIVGRNYEI